MNHPEHTVLAIALMALWSGFALLGLARLAARSPQWRDLLARLRRGGLCAEFVLDDSQRYPGGVPYADEREHR